MSNPFRAPWCLTIAGRILDADGTSICVLNPQVSPAVRDLIQHAPRTEALLTAFAQQLDQAHHDETEVLQVLALCATALAAVAEPESDLCPCTTPLLRARALLAIRRGEEVPSC